MKRKLGRMKSNFGRNFSFLRGGFSFSTEAFSISSGVWCRDHRSASRELEVRDQTTACGRTHRSPQSEGQRPERLRGQECHTKQATSPVWEVGLGLHPSSSPTHKGSTIYHDRLSIGRSGLCPSDRRLRCVGPLRGPFPLSATKVRATRIR